MDERLLSKGAKVSRHSERYRRDGTRDVKV